MNDFLPIILSILAALVVVGGLVPVLMKARKSGAKYPGTRDANDPVQSSAAGSGTLVEDRPDAVTAAPAPTFDGTVEGADVPDDAGDRDIVFRAVADTGLQGGGVPYRPPAVLLVSLQCTHARAFTRRRFRAG